MVPGLDVGDNDPMNEGKEKVSPTSSLSLSLSLALSLSLSRSRSRARSLGVCVRACARVVHSAIGQSSQHN